MFFSKQSSFFLFVFFSIIQCVQAKHFVLISAPGSGKGTFSQYLLEKYGYVQICAGDLFRHEILQQTELGKKIQSVVEAGDYVDEAITCQLMRQYLQQALLEKKQFILDGFPRSEHSLEFIKNFFSEQNIVDQVCFIQLQAADALCADRILSRIVCNTCFRVYNEKNLSSQLERKCEKCGASLATRIADQEEIAFKRLRYFHDSVEPLIEAVRGEYVVYKINVDQSLYALQGIYDEII